MSLKKILVPMDFSDCAKNAFKMSLLLANKCNGSIELITVARMPHVHTEVLGAANIIQPLLNELYEQIDEDYETLFKEIDKGNIPVNFQKFTSTLNDAVYSCVEQQNIDLIITGTKSEHDILENYLGSNSATLVGTAKVPVIVIPEKFTKTSIKRIGVAIDYKEMGSLEALLPLKEITQLLKAELLILNITKSYNKLFVYDDQKLALAEFFDTIPQSFHTYSDERKIGEILLKSVDELDLDMLFMLPKNHSILEQLLKPSKTKSMAMSTEIPLMTIHE